MLHGQSLPPHHAGNATKRAQLARTADRRIMRRYLNTIYVTSEDGWLRKDGANVVVEVEVAGQERRRAPLHMIGGIVCFAHAGASPALMAACAENGIALSFLYAAREIPGRVEGPRSGNVLLRRTQRRVADDPARAAAIVRGMVVANSPSSAPCCAGFCTIMARRWRIPGAQRGKRRSAGSTSWPVAP